MPGGAMRAMKSWMRSARTPTRRRHRWTSLTWFAVLVVASLALLPSLAQALEEVRLFRIGAGGTTGTYFQIAGALASAISKPTGTRDCEHGGSCGVPGLTAVAQATQGAVANVQAIGAGQLESALAQSDIVYWAYNGTPLPPRPNCAGGSAAPTAADRAAPIVNLRAIAGLYPEELHIVVRADSGIDTIEGLRGKRIALGERESGTLADARLVLAAAGLDDCDIDARYIGLSEAAEAMERGDLDGFFMVAGAPVLAVRDIASGLPLRILPIDGTVAERLMHAAPQFRPDKIYAGTYPGVEHDVATVSVTAVWVVGAEVPEPLVYAITKTLWRDATKTLLEAGHPAARRIRRDDALAGVAIPLHPGAARYYREAGMTLPAPLADTPPAK
jgi:TRAP transporter TAXI family solute receptor